MLSHFPSDTLCVAAAEMEHTERKPGNRKMATYGRSVSVDTANWSLARQSSSGSSNLKLLGPLVAGELIMSKSLSTSNITDLAQESEGSWYYDEASEEERIRIELEGDGPLGLSFAENHANDIVVHHLRRGTACSEFPDLEVGLVLRAVNGFTEVVDGGYHHAVDAVAASWAASNEVTLLFARRASAVPSSPPSVAGLQTTSGPPATRAGAVGQRAGSALRSIDSMSPIREPQGTGTTPQSTGQLRQATVPPALDLAGDSAPEPQPAAAAETKKQRNLRQVEEFLRDLKVDGYMSAFVDFGVSSMEDLSFIEPTDLPGFGLKPLQQRRVMTALTRLAAPDSV